MERPGRNSAGNDKGTSALETAMFITIVLITILAVQCLVLYIPLE